MLERWKVSFVTAFLRKDGWGFGNKVVGAVFLLISCLICNCRGCQSTGLITFKFFCINVKKVAWILANHCPHEGIGDSFAGEYRITLLWGALSRIKYIIEEDSSRMRHLCWSCTRFDDSEPSLAVPFQFSVGKSWKENTSSTINIVTECKGGILFLGMVLSVLYWEIFICRVFACTGGVRRKPRVLSSLWRGPENI